MTPDELKSNFVRAAVGLLAYAAGRYHFSVETVDLMTKDITIVGSVAAFGYGGYLHWGMKKVPATAIVSPTRTAAPNNTGLAMLLAFGLAALLAFGSGQAHAANLSPVLKAPIAAAPAKDCTQLDCSGWLAGVNLMGSGSNADILGSGLNGSVFAGGGLVGFDAGGQLWNGKYFGGFLASIDYDANMSGVLPNQGRVLGMVLVQAGVGLSGIFAPSPGSAPTGIPATIASALVSPYLNFGAAIRARGDAWVTGAGAEFDLSSAWLLRIDYLHLDYSHGKAAPGLGGVVDPSSVENLVKATLLRRFDSRFLGS